MTTTSHLTRLAETERSPRSLHLSLAATEGGATLSTFGQFGERGLLTGTPHTANVIAVSKRVELMRIEKSDFAALVAVPLRVRHFPPQQ
eukprot:1181784-Prorocentrum_minimum.AAC.5